MCNFSIEVVSHIYVYSSEVPDDPPVEAAYSTLIGLLGLIFVSTEVGFFVVLDISTIRRHLRFAHESVRRGCPCCRSKPKEVEEEESSQEPPPLQAEPEETATIANEDHLEVVDLEEDTQSVESYGLPWLYREPTPCLDLTKEYADLIWSPLPERESTDISMISLGSSVHLGSPVWESDTVQSLEGSQHSTAWLILEDEEDHKVEESVDEEPHHEGSEVGDHSLSDNISEATLDLNEEWLSEFHQEDEITDVQPSRGIIFPPIKSHYGDSAKVSDVMQMIPEHMFSPDGHTRLEVESSSSKESEGSQKKKRPRWKSLKKKSKKTAPKRKPSEFIRERIKKMHSVYS